LSSVPMVVNMYVRFSMPFSETRAPATFPHNTRQTPPQKVSTNVSQKEPYGSNGSRVNGILSTTRTACCALQTYHPDISCFICIFTFSINSSKIQKSCPRYPFPHFCSGWIFSRKEIQVGPGVAQGTRQIDYLSRFPGPF